MQPAQSIPPLTKEGVQMLVGMRARVKRKSNPNKVWWVTIEKVHLLTETAALVEAKGCKASGKSKRYCLEELRFKGHVDEPIKIAIHRAQLEAKKGLYETQIQSR